ncbi:MAG: 4-hydroxybenzoate octaprenyltransferase [Proteobacteria bacterium]|nr:4-hydroxybenzoate octaprenyltransferase [Pseudomonadota bacterium]
MGQALDRSERSDQLDWIDRRAPRALRPYLKLARIDRPIGIWLLLWPAFWSLALAGQGAPDPWLLLLFALGALIMRGAGCTYNDIVDRRIDGRVARTARRPLPAGEISVRGALVFLALQLTAGLAILLSLDPFAIALGAGSLVLIAAYPFMKRITYWPQAFLGLTFNWGALLGWAAARGTIDWPALVLYGACILWTLGYDTIYAHQDKEDDALVGIKSTALKLGDKSRPWIAAFYGGTVGLLALAGALAHIAWPFYLGLAAAAGLLAWQVVTLKLNEPGDCLAKFKSNALVGLLLFVGLLLSALAIP